MNKELLIEKFRQEKLPKYIEEAEATVFIKKVEYRRCATCGELLPVTDFFRDSKECRNCSNKKLLAQYFKRQLGKHGRRKANDKR